MTLGHSTLPWRLARFSSRTPHALSMHCSNKSMIQCIASVPPILE
jgi:hypothetical protein